VPLPDRRAKAFTHTPAKGLRRHESDALAAWEQACRQRWRALALVVKAKLEAVEAGISTFEEEFMAHLILPSGHTVGSYALPRLRAALESGKMPSNLLGLPPAPAGAEETIDAEVIE
jgi:hypothetical protein